MRIRHDILCVAAVLCVAAWPAYGQTFDSGSSCATDPVNPPCLGDVIYSSNTTVALPADGILHYGTLTVDPGVTLSFTPNALNTPVHILASGVIVVDGTIAVNGTSGSTSGEGGPGGFGGGRIGLLGDPGGTGLGPGAGAGGSVSGNVTGDTGGNAGYGTQVTANPNDGPTYGSELLVPLVGGSGGGGSPGYGGAGGGGAVLLASSNSIAINGTVAAAGGTTFSTRGSNGSGGAIRLVAPLVSGAGTLNVNGGQWTTAAGRGRTRVDVIDRSQLSSLSGVDSIGAYLRVFLEPRPSLDVVQVASQVIPAGTSAPVQFSLPFEAPATQDVIVQASDFSGVTTGCAGPTPCLPVRVILIPDTGPTVTVDGEINLSGGSPAQTTIPIDFPANVPVRVQAWTR